MRFCCFRCLVELWLRLAHPFHPSFMLAGSWMMLAVLLIGLPLYAFTGQYRSLTRYLGSTALYRLAARNGLLVLLLAGIGVMLRLPMPPRSSWILLWLLLTVFTGLCACSADVLLSLRASQHEKQMRIAIYGAGEAGVQLAAALRLAGNHIIVTFLDDNPVYWSRSVNGVAIQPPQVLTALKNSLDGVFLAIPSLARSERRRIVDDLQRRGIRVLQVPLRMTSPPAAPPSIRCGRLQLRIYSVAMSCRCSRALDPAFVQPWSASPVLADLLLRALPPDPGVVASKADTSGAQ